MARSTKRDGIGHVHPYSTKKIAALLGGLLSLAAMQAGKLKLPLINATVTVKVVTTATEK